MTDHHDFADHGADHGYGYDAHGPDGLDHDGLDHDGLDHGLDDHDGLDDHLAHEPPAEDRPAQPWPDDPGAGHDTGAGHDADPAHPVGDAGDAPDGAHDTTDQPGDIDAGPETVDVFPPLLDVGELPEPVDGFPWTDPASLGPAAFVGTGEPVQPQELADYAGIELPPGADPWAVLADSDDPAVSALARWWSGN